MNGLEFSERLMPARSRYFLCVLAGNVSGVGLIRKCLNLEEAFDYLKPGFKGSRAI